MKNKFKIIFFLATFLLFFEAKSQQGKNHSPTITTSTVVNKYTSASANITTGTNTLTVTSATGYTVGDLIYIIQMQGAGINAEYNQYGDHTNSYQVDTTKPYGQVLNYNNCGNNEFAQISAVSGTTFTVDCNLKNNYDISGKVQVILVPRFDTLTINSGGIITCQPWNGTTGGVIAIEVSGTTTINTGGKIDASALGFRGGNIHKVPSIFGPTNLGTTHWTYGAWKGEGVGGDTAFYRTLSGDFGIGAMANGGGGGIENNSGGGGGANAGNIGRWKSYGVPDVSVTSYSTAFSIETPKLDTAHSSGGGRGGYTFSQANKDPRSVIPGDATWNGDKRSNKGGQGGQPLDYSTGRLFMGGGGGAGDEDDGYSGSGGNGGGIIYFLSYGTISGKGQILSNGANGVTTNTTTAGGGSGTPRGKDGAGGAGGGGTIILQSKGNISLTNALPITANGGNGGNQILNCTAATSEAYGPGGGGGGGYIGVSNSVTNITVAGGVNGVCSQVGLSANNNTNIIKYFPQNGATKGDTGIKATIIPPFTLTGISDTVCAGSTASLSVIVNGIAPSSLSVVWYADSTGGTAIATGNTYTFTAPSTTGTHAYYAGSCPGTYRIPILLIVNSSSTPTITITTPTNTICSGTTITLTAHGVSSYTWDANAGNATGTNTVSVTPPVGNTTYTLTGANTGACAGTNTASITITANAPPTITITPTSYSICSGVRDTLTATGATSYTWSSNAGSAATGSVSVLPATIGNTTYSVTGVSGACTASQSISINVITQPTVSISPPNAYICKGFSATLTASGATTYSWSTISSTNTVVAVSPTSNTTYTVKGSNGNGMCSDTKTVLVKVDNGITMADSSLTAATCGQPNGSYVLNSVTGGISPYQINFNSSSTYTSIPSFSYTVSNNLQGNITYPVLIKDSLGCVYTTSVKTTNNSVITGLDSSTISAKCVPSNSGSIAINSITGGTPSYSININGGVFSQINSFPYQFNNLTAGTYTISVKDGSNCPYPSYIKVDTIAHITTFTLSPIISDTCHRNIGEITASNIIGGSAPYQFALNGGSAQSAATFSLLPQGLYTVTVTDNNGCAVSKSDSVKNVQSISTPTVTPTGSSSICPGDSVILTSSSTYYNVWSTNISADTTRQLIVKDSGSYFVTITKNGCSAASNTVTIHIKPKPVTQVAAVTNICSNQLPYIVPITVPVGATITVFNTLGQSLPIPFTPTVQGVYFVNDVLNGCSTLTKIIVNIGTAPSTAPTVTTPVTYCQEQTADTLKALTTVSNATLVWQDASHNTIITPPTPTPSTNIAGTTTYYVYQSNAGCLGLQYDSIKVIVTGKPNPNFNIAPSTNISVAQTVSFTPVQTTTGNFYYWDFDDPTSNTLNNSTSPLPNHTYNTAGSYCPKLLVINQAGCKDSARSICLDALANISIVIPNIFSPNGDGLNDVFSVKATGYTNFTCDIFDRWGLKLYSWTGVNGYWDGSEKTSKAVDGTYFYVIQTTDVKGEDHKFNGFIQLIK